MRAMSILRWRPQRKRSSSGRATPAAERSRILLRIADLIERDLEKLARAESIDTSKPLSLARTLDSPRAASNFRFFATAILHTESEAHITNNVAFNYTLRQPRGIAGRKGNSKLHLSKYALDSSRRVVESNGDLHLSRNVRDVAAVHSTLWPEDQVECGILNLKVLTSRKSLVQFVQAFPEESE
jgi:aminomuconate-semialdehyde/2-hydroxymuconate-6-semialdehyde dehydrogenase